MTGKPTGWTGDDLRRQLAEDCGVRPGDILIVHSSMKSLGWVQGGPGAVVAAIQAAVTCLPPAPACPCLAAAGRQVRQVRQVRRGRQAERGTILMPVFTAPAPDGFFDILGSPSRTGLISEIFRRSPGVVRSHHPTHSVAAWGSRAAELAAGHDRTSGLGVGSPFHKAATAGASILMIGCRITACSLIHVAEAIVRVPYIGKVCYAGYDRTLTLVDESGRREEVPPRDVPTDSAGFTVVAEGLDRRGLLGRCRLGSAECLKFRGCDALDVAVGLLRADPAALLCRNAACPVCVPARRTVDAAMGA